MNPNVVELLRTVTGAPSVITLVDESDLLLQPFRRTIRRDDIVRLAALAGVSTVPFDGSTIWNTNLTLLAGAATEDLRAGDWSLPAPSAEWVLEIQRLGMDRYGEEYRYVGYDLRLLSDSDPTSRGWDGDALTFAAAPALGDEFAIFTGSIATGLVRHRLDPDRKGCPLHAPFEHVRFAHPGTRWLNINNRAGAARHFGGNSGRVLDFFARLIARNIRAEKRTLLVCRKKFRRLCQLRLTTRLSDLGVGPVRVVTDRWDEHDLTDPRTLPLITYGVSGINRFEHCDAAYCLTGYYTAPAAVEELVNDLEAPANRVTIRLGFTGVPARRTATVEDPAALHTVVPELARWALAQKEADVVVQAVGRVRPFTRPREVITFQSGDLPGVSYDREFLTLGEARQHFALVTTRRGHMNARAVEARRLCDGGLTWEQIGATMKVSRATVARYLSDCPADE